MGERLAWLAGDTAGRDHGFAVLGNDNGEFGPDYQFWAPLAELEFYMKWLWRVKECISSGTITYHLGSDPFAVDCASLAPAVRQSNFSALAANELDLLKARYRFYLTTHGPAIAIWDRTDRDTGPQVLWNAAENKFRIPFDLVYFNGALVVITTRAGSSWPLFGDFYTVEPTGHFISFDGLAVELHIAASSIVDPPSIVASTAAVSASSFFPYATTDGSPVWDEVSGAQINNPFG